MTTLQNRATPAQRVVFRMIEGACWNAAHHHPDWHISPRMARSIAKRATGTLTSQWGAVLVASERSEGSGGQISTAAPKRLGLPFRATPRERVAASTGALPTLIRTIAREIGPAKRAGRVERAEALIWVLRLMSRAIQP